MSDPGWLLLSHLPPAPLTLKNTQPGLIPAGRPHSSSLPLPPSIAEVLQGSAPWAQLADTKRVLFPDSWYLALGFYFRFLVVPRSVGEAPSGRNSQRPRTALQT